MSKVVTRFAPSPTGFLHIGGVRTALFAWLWARKHNGTFILRIEDTDKEREVAGSIEHIKESLQYLGIDWDYGPDTPGPFGSCIQSERLDTYQAWAKKLIEKGLAYPDPYSKEELEGFRELAKNEKRPFLFRDHRPETFEDWDGTKPLRLKVPEIKRYTWQDAVRGELSAGEEMLDDFILIKADGYPTYNFAHIIDDYEMGVTHIMRADEFISSVPKYLSLYEALEIEPPIFGTQPPIMAPDGKKKLGKRDGAKDILDYRADGFLPATMMNFLALIGWNPGTEQELFTTKELTDLFEITDIQSSGGAFNVDKLNWMNKQYLERLTVDEQFAYLKSALPETTSNQSQYSEERLLRLVPTVFERIHSQAEIRTAAEAGEYDWVFAAPVADLALVAWKKDTEQTAWVPRLQTVRALWENADFSSPETIKEAIWEYAETEGRGEVLWPTRVALTGLERSPDPFTSAYIIGREETLSRLQTICDKMGA